MLSRAEALDEAVLGLGEQIRGARQYLHRNPEPSGQELATTAWLSELFTSYGVRHRVARSGRGLVVESSPEAAPTIVLRADTDALRIQDAKEVPYRSLRDNLMHACGHDAHTAMLVGATLALWKEDRREPFAFRWRCVFQPAEETGVGALEMIKEGVLEHAAGILALHVDPTLETGVVGVREGALTAFCDEWEIVVHGQAGHGARPHLTRDPIAAATQLVQAIYGSRCSLDPSHPAVFSVGMIEAGANPNVIPGRCRLMGTLRSHARETSDQRHTRVREICAGVAAATGTEITYRTVLALPGVINDPGWTRTFARAASEVAQTVPIPEPSMGGEDFASYLEHVPGSMLRLGCRKPGETERHLHTPEFDIDEDCLLIGARLLARAVLDASPALLPSVSSPSTVAH